MHINDPIFGDEVAQQSMTVVPFVEYWSNLLGLNSTAMANLSRQHEECGYKDFLEKYMTYPAIQEPFPAPKPVEDDHCDTLGYLYYAATEINPCFSLYHIIEYCPLLNSVLGTIGEYIAPPLHSTFRKLT